MKRQLMGLLDRVGMLGVVERTTRPLRFALRRPAISRFYAPLISPGDLCFDVGANIGQWTQALLNIGATVVAIEPQGVCVQKLRRRFAGNSKAIIVSKAISSESGTAQLAVDPTCTELATMATHWREDGPYPSDRWGQTEEVATTTLDQLIAEYGMPRMIKIDVEGHERAVLEGLSRMPAWLSFEFTRKFLAEADQCMRRLESLGEVEFNVALAENPVKLASEAWLGRDGILRLIEIEQAAWAGDIHARLERSSVEPQPASPCS